MDWLRSAKDISTTDQYTNAIENLFGQALDVTEKGIVKKSAQSIKALNTEGMEQVLKAMHIDAKRENVPVTDDLIGRLDAVSRVLVTIESKPPKTYLYAQQADGSWTKQDTSNGTTTPADSPGTLVRQQQVPYITVLQIGQRQILNQPLHISLPDSREKPLPKTPQETAEKTKETPRTKQPVDDEWQAKYKKHMEEGMALLKEQKHADAKKCFDAALDAIDKSSTPDPTKKFDALIGASRCLTVSDPAFIKVSMDKLEIIERLAKHPPKGYLPESFQTALAVVYQDLGEAHMTHMNTDKGSADAAKMAKQYLDLAIQTRKKIGPQATKTLEYADALDALIKVHKGIGDTNVSALELESAETRGALLYADHNYDGAAKSFRQAADLAKDADMPDLKRAANAINHLCRIYDNMSSDKEYFSIRKEHVEVLNKLVEDQSLSKTDTTVYLGNLVHRHTRLAEDYQELGKTAHDSTTGLVTEHLDGAIKALQKAGETIKLRIDHVETVEQRIALFPNDVEEGTTEFKWKAQLEKELATMRAEVYPGSASALLRFAKSSMENLKAVGDSMKTIKLKEAKSYIKKVVEMENKLKSSDPKTYAQIVTQRAAYTAEVLKDEEKAKELRKLAAEAEQRAQDKTA